MKIIHIVESFGGGVFEFLRILTSEIEGEHFIIHAIRKDTPTNYKSLFNKNVKFILWKSAAREINPIKDLKALVELIKILKSLNSAIDVLHLHSSKAGFFGRLSAKFLGLSNKVIYTTHGISFLRKDISSIKKELFIFLEKLAFKFGGKVIACSKSEAEFIRKYGISSDYIYNGIKCPPYLEEDNLKPNQKIKIITVGRISYQKNPWLFQKIAQYFLPSKDLEFIWVGDGELRNILNLPNIKITGWVSQEEVFKFLMQADIYLSTSLWEGLPLAVLQAMCVGLPLVLNNCVGNVDLVKENYNGFVFKNYDEAIEKLNILIRSTKKRLSMGKASIDLVRKNFTLDKMINRYKQLYKQVSYNKRKNGR